MASVWGVEPESLPGKGVPAVELLGKLGGEVRALMVHGSNPVVSAPDATAVRRRLAELDLLVVCDFVPSETAELADVVLPVTQWAEEEGTMTSLEGRVLRRRQLLAPPGAARSELEILADLARLLGSPVTLDRVPAVVFDELARASAGGRADYSGLSHATLDDDSPRFWPAGPGSSPSRHRGSSPRPSRTRTALPGWCPSQRVALPTTFARRLRSTSSRVGCWRSTSPAPRPAGFSH